MIKALDAAKDDRPPEPSGAVGPDPTSTDIPLLTLEEKRRILARIARVNPTDCFDDAGVFDIARAKRVLPPGAVRYIAIQETTRIDAEGQPITERSIQLRLVDPVSALRLEDQLERRRERTATASSPPPASDSTPPHPASPEYAHNLLRQKTKGLDEANHTLALLRKALAEADDRELQLSKELEEKDRQLSQTLSKVEADAIQRDTGCQPVELQHQNKPSRAASSVEKQPLKSFSDEPEFVGHVLCPPEFPNTPEPGAAFDAENLSPTSTAFPSHDEAQCYTGQQPFQEKPQVQRDTGCQPVQEKLQTSPRSQPVDAKNSMESAALAERPRNRAMEPANVPSQDPPTKCIPAKPKKFGGYQPYGSSARPPPRAWRS